MARPIAQGLAVAIGAGVVWAVLSAVLNLHVGLLVVAAFAGWLIGSTVRPAGRRARPAAVALGLLAWLVGSILDFVLSQLLLPTATTSAAERLTASAYVAYAIATFDVVTLISIALLVVVAWRSAR